MLIVEVPFIKFKFYPSSITLIHYPRNVARSHTAVIKHHETLGKIQKTARMTQFMLSITSTVLMVLPNHI